MVFLKIVSIFLKWFKGYDGFNFLKIFDGFLQK